MGISFDPAEDAITKTVEMAIPGTYWTKNNHLRCLVVCVSMTLCQNPNKFYCVCFFPFCFIFCGWLVGCFVWGFICLTSALGVSEQHRPNYTFYKGQVPGVSLLLA